MKVFLIRNLLVYLFLSSLSVLSFGKTGGDPPIATLGSIITDPDGNGDDDLIFFDGCDGETVTLRVPLANLIPLPMGGIPNNIGLLPLEQPKIYLRYSIDNGPVVTELLGNFTFWKYINDIPVYESLIESYPLYLCGRCNGEFEPTIVSFSAELLMCTASISGGECNDFYYAPYPACEYTDSDEIFSCNVFEPAGGCDQNATCDEIGLTTNSEPLNLYCPLPHEGDGGDGDGESRNAVNDSGQAFSDLSVQPNPFGSQLEVNWVSDNSIKSMAIYDTSGRLIKNWNQNQLSISTRLHIDTHKLPKGLYFLKVKSDTDSKVIKVVKQ